MVSVLLLFAKIFIFTYQKKGGGKVKRAFIVLFFVAVFIILGLAVTGVMAGSGIWFFLMAPNTALTVLAIFALAGIYFLINRYEDWFILNW